MKKINIYKPFKINTFFILSIFILSMCIIESLIAQWFILGILISICIWDDYNIIAYIRKLEKKIKQKATH